VNEPSLRVRWGARSMKGQSPIITTAGIAAAILLISLGWKLGNSVEKNPDTDLAFERPTTEEVLGRVKTPGRAWQEELATLGLISTSTDASAVATSTLTVADMISHDFINAYLSLKESGKYSKETAASIGKAIGENVRAPSQFVVHGEGELNKDSDTSRNRALVYRADMRDALAVLITDAPPEFETFGLYVETKNPERLRGLEEAATRYQTAERTLLHVIVPMDAAALHLRAVNALGSYADALNQLIRHADDSLSILAVLRTYNDAERELLYAFDALASYYVRKASE
jgi:hypothetical protein